MTETVPANSAAFQAILDAQQDAQMERRDECLQHGGVTHAHGSIVFSDQPGNTSTLTIKGVSVEFRTSPASGKVTIGSDLAGTLTNLVAFLRASVDADLSLMDYRCDATHLFVTAKGIYNVGNAYGLVAGAGSNGTASGSTLTDGAVVAKPWAEHVSEQLSAAADRIWTA